jgi:uncharacterized protein YggE
MIVISSPARADDVGIVVSGTGEIQARPTHVEIELTAAASAELTGDAIVKYQDSLRRTLAAFEGLKFKNLDVEQRGLSIASGVGNAAVNAQVMNAAGRAGGAALKPQTDISRSLRLVLRGIKDLPEAELMETISKLLDTAKDCGAVVGPQNANSAMITRMIGVGQASNPVLTFVADDADALREQAYEQAFAQAEARARRLAKLAKVELGPVIAVEETIEPAEAVATPERIVSTVYGLKDSQKPVDHRLTSDKLGDIPVRINLRVRFAIAEKGGK